jgi:hypothetical protein
MELLFKLLYGKFALGEEKERERERERERMPKATG